MFSLITRICSLSTIVISLFILANILKKEEKKPIIIDVSKIVELPKDTNNEIKASLNTHLEQVSSVCGNVSVTAWKGGRKTNLTGKIYCSEEDGFRMMLTSFLGKELDLGRNKKKLWYWSKRDKDPGLHWAFIEEFSKTRLKTPFNPIFIQSTFGIEQIGEQSEVRVNGNEVIVQRQEKNGRGENVLHILIYDLSEKRLMRSMLLDSNNRKIAESKIEKYYGRVPQTIRYEWCEENAGMIVSFTYLEENRKMPATIFEMPEISPSHNMTDD